MFPSSAPQNVAVSLRGFLDVTEAHELAHAAVAAIKIIGETLDLSGLDGVTIGYDYDDALASVAHPMARVDRLKKLSR